MHSPRWHRVSALKPSLSPQLQLRRQHLRGQTWMLLVDPGSGRSVRLNAAAWAFVGRLDGQRTVHQLWQRMLGQPGDMATQDELIDLLAQLREASLLRIDRSADFDQLLPHLERVTRPRERGNLIAWRVRLGNPSAWLDRLRPVQRLMFSRAALALWCAALVMLVALAVQHAPRLWAFGQQWLATPRFALLGLLLYVPIKLVHELAHGLAVRRWGGQVHHAGVTLMLLMPVPYVDASAANGFARRRQRIAVSAAGIMTELGLAAMALPLWLWLDEGMPRDAAFATLVIAGVSTLLFNANPLQRLDGYYILCDALQLPNLGPRSRAWWLALLQRRLLRLPGAEAMPVAPGESPWLAAYAPLAWLMSLAIATLAVAWLGQLSLALGLACAALLGWQMALRPVYRLLVQLRRAALAQQGSARRWRRLALGGSLAALALLLLPWPQRTLVQGVVWPPDQAQLRADEDGLVEAVLVRDGQHVRAGEAVLQLGNPSLLASHARQAARVVALEAELFNALPGAAAGARDRGAGDAQAELAAAQSELQRLDDRVAALAVRAHSDGRLALPAAADLPGQFVRRGSLLGQVLDDAPPRVRVAWPEAGDLQRLKGSVSVRLATAPGDTYGASLVRDASAAVLQLPSAALSTRHGGPVLTDPQDPKDLKPLQPVVLLDVLLDRRAHGSAGGAHPAQRLGERAWVRFDAGWSPLALHVARGLRQQVLLRFNPQF